MFKKLFGSKGSGGGGGGGPAAGGGGFGAPKTSPLSAVEKLKDVRAPARCSPKNKKSSRESRLHPLTLPAHPISQTLAMLEKREALLHKKMAAELEKKKRLYAAMGLLVPVPKDGVTIAGLITDESGRTSVMLRRNRLYGGGCEPRWSLRPIPCPSLAPANQRTCTSEGLHALAHVCADELTEHTSHVFRAQGRSQHRRIVQ